MLHIEFVQLYFLFGIFIIQIVVCHCVRVPETTFGSVNGDSWQQQRVVQCEHSPLMVDQLSNRSHLWQFPFVFREKRERKQNQNIELLDWTLFNRKSEIFII